MSNPEAKEQRESALIDSLIKKYFPIDATVISTNIAEEILRVGRERILLQPEDENDPMREDWKYQKLCEQDPDTSTNNLWNTFLPRTAEAVNELFVTINDLQQDIEDGFENENAISRLIDQTYWSISLFVLVHDGYLKRIFTQLGIGKVTRFMQLQLEADALRTNRSRVPEEGSAERELYLQRIYIMLHDMGINGRRLDG